jgi:hypothetical protein
MSGLATSASRSVTRVPSRPKVSNMRATTGVAWLTIGARQVCMGEWEPVAPRPCGVAAVAA